MRQFAILSICLFFVSSALAAEIGNNLYHGYQVYSVAASNPAEFDHIVKMHDEGIYDFWTDPKINGYTDINVSPEQKDAFLKNLHDNELVYVVKIENVGKLVHEEQMNNKLQSQQSPKMDWTSYRRHADLITWLEEHVHQSDIAHVETIGRSTEGRHIKMVTISSGPSPSKKGIFIEGGIHAREWISTATVTWMINELITNKDKYEELLDKFDFYIVPASNPDGYEHCHTTSRLWRKTRSNHAGGNCYGVDPNRNWGYKWGGLGTSNDPCSDIYRGPRAFSEPETMAIRDAVTKLQNEGKQFSVYFSVHSYGQWWLIPWGYDFQKPGDYNELLRVANLAVAKLQSVHGTRYTAGNSADLLYPAAGASDDWAKGPLEADGGANIPYSYTVELRDGGQFGFLLPANQIIPCATEAWEAFQEVFRTAMV